MTGEMLGEFDEDVMETMEVVPIKDKGSVACFPSHAHVELKGSSDVHMDDCAVGDKVKVDVYFFRASLKDITMFTRRLIDVENEVLR